MPLLFNHNIPPLAQNTPMAIYRAYPMTPLNQLQAELIDFDTAILPFTLGWERRFVS